ncbi:MAG: hypothetical protein OEN50_17620 [Deltaproteobacteria bacterium]|nr:hypothetical protein [Deltaproteobacteria bacterium]
MKNVSFFAIKAVLILAVIYGGYLLFDKFTGLFKGSPFPDKEDQVQIKVIQGKIPASIKIKNNTGYKVRVQVFNATDAAFDSPVAIPRDSFHIDANSSKTYTPGFRYKVYRAAFLDQYKGASPVVNADVTIASGGDAVTFNSASKPVTFINRARENLKIGVYLKDDGSYISPLLGTGFIELSHGEEYKWTNAPTEFRVRVFRPQFLDKILGTRTGVKAGSTITIE